MSDADADALLVERNATDHAHSPHLQGATVSRSKLDAIEPRRKLVACDVQSQAGVNGASLAYGHCERTVQHGLSPCIDYAELKVRFDGFGR